MPDEHKVTVVRGDDGAITATVGSPVNWQAILKLVLAAALAALGG